MSDSDHLRLVKAHLDARLAGDLEELARKSDRPLAAEIRRAVRFYVEQRRRPRDQSLLEVPRDAVSRIVAAREEIQIGELAQADVILADLEVEITGQLRKRETP